MKRGLLIIALLTCLSMAAACGSDSGPDLSGIYTTTSHTLNMSDCTTEGMTESEPPFFQMEMDEFIGFPIFTYTECMSSDPADCTGSSLSFLLKASDGWTVQISSSSGFGGGSCNLGWTVGSALLQDDDSLRIEYRQYSEEAPEIAGDSEECDPDEAERRGDSMPCDSYEVITGTLLN